MSIDTAATTLIAGSWTIDPAHSTVGFTARHLMSKVRGTFTEFSGDLKTTTDPTESTITSPSRRPRSRPATSSATATCVPPTSSTPRPAAT